MTATDLDCSVHADLATRATLAGEELPPAFASCLECAARLRALRDLRDAGQSIGWTVPDAARASLVRSRILGAVAPPRQTRDRRFARRRRPASFILAVSAAAALVAMVIVHRGKDVPVRMPSAEVSLGAITPVGAARFDRISKAPDEVIRLVEGRIHVEVAHLAPAERFRIITGDSVVEVRGTAFDVEASSAGLQEVAVERGRVEVKVGTNPPSVVGAGSHWAVREVAATPPPGPVPEPAIVPVPVRVAHPPRARAERLENVPLPEAPAVATVSPPGTGAPAALPAAELQTRVPVSAPLEAKKLPVSGPKPPAVAPATVTPPSEREPVRREREDQRAERRELREERRLERLERRR